MSGRFLLLKKEKFVIHFLSNIHGDNLAAFCGSSSSQ